MKLSVHHVTHYQYSKAVWLQPHVIRLHPRFDGTLRLDRFEIKIDPEPSMLSTCLDIEGNTVIHAWFRETTSHLHIDTRFDVEPLRANPFDYLLGASGDTLPIAYADEISASIAAYRLRGDTEDPVSCFAHELAEKCGRRTLDFLNALNDEIYQSCRIFVRETGAPNPPGYTLEHREGSCRDVAMLFIDACRAVGIAARFVSGYQRGDPDKPRERWMHAWPEVYLPGGGWRGYDPTHGLAVGDDHVAVAACREPHGATPVEGSFRGSGATAAMEAKVEIS